MVGKPRLKLLLFTLKEIGTNSKLGAIFVWQIVQNNFDILWKIFGQSFKYESLIIDVILNNSSPLAALKFLEEIRCQSSLLDNCSSAIELDASIKRNFQQDILNHFEWLKNKKISMMSTSLFTYMRILSTQFDLILYNL